MCKSTQNWEEVMRQTWTGEGDAKRFHWTSYDASTQDRELTWRNANDRRSGWACGIEPPETPDSYMWLNHSTFSLARGICGQANCHRRRWGFLLAKKSSQRTTKTTTSDGGKTSFALHWELAKFWELSYSTALWFVNIFKR